MDIAADKYICLVCNEEISSLYRSTSGHFIKVVECMKCGNAVDHYIECENSIIITDLIMQESAAYKHILFNSKEFSSQFYTKLALCIVIVEGYMRWISMNNDQYSEDKSIKNNEFSFYKLCFIAFIEFCLFFISINGIFTAVGLQRSVSRSLKGMIIGQGGRLLNIATIVYKQGNSLPFDVFIMIFVLSSSTQSVRVTFQPKMFPAILSVMISCLLSKLASNVLQTAIM